MLKVILAFLLLTSAICADTELAIVKASVEFGVRYRILSRMAKLESNNNPLAINSYSSARGLFQITKATQISINTKCPECKFGNIFDPLENARMASWLFTHNRKLLKRKIKRTPTDWEVYIVHNIGLRYAISLIQAEGSTLITKILKHSYIQNNRKLYTKRGKILTVLNVKSNIKELLGYNATSIQCYNEG